jgi:hypothetical protein
VRGNLPAGVSCRVCEKDLSALGGSDGKRCTRCFQVVHTETCQLPQHCRPLHEQLLLVRKSLHSQLERWTPLAVFVNVRSGGGEGVEIVARLKQLLDEKQIFLLDGNNSPERGLKQFSELGAATRVLVAGGDGTVNWLFQYMPEHAAPPVAILPLGTGNDLARSLGWSDFASVRIAGMSYDTERYACRTPT